MSAKVSMVITCYNKQDYIGKMLDSVIAQNYNKIEVVLVNDGSTDNSLSIIREYLPKLKVRGYRVIIVNQKNMGRAPALKVGLMKITGEYVCMPDGDDMLLPNYISEPVEYLRTHKDTEMVIGDFSSFSFVSLDNKYLKGINPVNFETLSQEQLVKMWLIRLGLTSSVWTACVRTSYLKACKIIENIDDDRNFSQEPQTILPLLMGGGKIFYLRKPIYEYNSKAPSSVCNSAYMEREKIEELKKTYIESIESQLKKRNAFNSKDSIALQIREAMWLFIRSDFHTEIELIDRLLKCANIGIRKEDAYKIGMCVLHYYTASIFCKLKITDKINVVKKNRIIAYGAFGKAAKQIRTGLHNSNIVPHEYWDIEARESDKIMETPVYYPQFRSLTGDETILILLQNYKIAKNVTEKIKEFAPDVHILYYYDILDYLTKFFLGNKPEVREI